MNQDASEQGGDDGPQYLERTPADYLDSLPSELRSSFSEPQLAAVQHLLAAAIPKSSPKLVDLQFCVNLLAYRYYVVFFVGKDRRHRDRPEHCKELSHNCIALGQETSNQKLSEYVEKTQELKAENRKMETAPTIIKLKLM